MIVNRVRGLNLLHCVCQASIVLFLFWVWAHVIAAWNPQGYYQEQTNPIYLLCIGAAFILDLGRTRLLQRNLLHLDIVQNHRLSFRQSAEVAGALVLYLVAAKDESISRLFLFSFIPALYIALFLSNRYLPRWLAAFVFKTARMEKTVLIGSAENAQKLWPWLERKSHYGFETIGLIGSEPETDLSSPHLPLLGDLSETEEILTKSEATQVILLDLPFSPGEIAGLGDLCDRLGVRLHIVNDLEDKLHRSICFTQDDGFHFICFRQEPLECPMGRIVKRAFDIALSLPVVLFVLPPVTLIVWLLQRFQSPGPLLFIQRRNGQHNTVFRILKFRSMHVTDADEGIQATQNDPRVFPAGKWMRKLSIDELPQFINVLNGEMSIVGPRPHFVHHETLFGEIANFYRVRSFIKPGITGLAQVRGLRGEASKAQDILDRVHSDLYYLENWSLVLDWAIIVKTAWQMVLPPKRAY